MKHYKIQFKTFSAIIRTQEGWVYIGCVGEWKDFHSNRIEGDRISIAWPPHPLDSVQTWYSLTLIEGTLGQPC